MGLFTERAAREGALPVESDGDTGPVTLVWPDGSVRQEAVIRVSACLFDQPGSPAGTRYAAAWRNSGAAALVAPWVSRKAIAVAEDADV